MTHEMAGEENLKVKGLGKRIEMERPGKEN